MGSSPSSNQKRSHATISSSAADVVRTDVQDTLPSPHVTRSNAAFSYDSTQFGSQANMGDEISRNLTGLTDSQQRMVRICLGELETNLGIAFNCDDNLMDCVKV